jgi:hypothetical protein
LIPKVLYIYRECQKFFPLRHMLKKTKSPLSPLSPLSQRGELSEIPLKVPL